MNAKAGEHRRSELCGLDFTISARCKPIDLFSTTSLESQESYLTSGMLPYNHSSRSLEIFTAYTVLSHGSIMLPPRQPRVFARLARVFARLARVFARLARWQLPDVFRMPVIQHIFHIE